MPDSVPSPEIKAASNMGEQTKSRKEKVMVILLNGLAIIGVGLALTGWLNPEIGVALIGAGVIYWLWEILTLKFVSTHVTSGWYRAFIGAAVIAAIVAVSWSPTRKRLYLEHSIADLPAIYQHALHSYIRVTVDDQYPEGAMVAGVPWRKGSILATVYLSTEPKTKLFNVELQLTFDAQFIHASQITQVPNVILQPVQHSSTILGAEGGGLDKNGKPMMRRSATPEEIELINTYPASQFIFKQSETFPNLPITLVFVGGSGYKLGSFTNVVPKGATAPHKLNITGHYNVQYGDQSHTVPYNEEMHQ